MTHTRFYLDHLQLGADHLEGTLARMKTNDIIGKELEYQARKLPYVKHLQQLFIEFDKACKESQVPPLKLLAGMALGKWLDTEPQANPALLPLVTEVNPQGRAIKTPYVRALQFEQAAAYIFLGASRVARTDFTGLEHGNYRLGIQRQANHLKQVGLFWREKPVAHIPLLERSKQSPLDDLLAVSHVRYVQRVPDAQPDRHVDHFSIPLNNGKIRVKLEPESVDVFSGRVQGKRIMTYYDASTEPAIKRVRLEGRKAPRNEIIEQGKYELWDAQGQIAMEVPSVDITLNGAFRNSAGHIWYRTDQLVYKLSGLISTQTDRSREHPSNMILRRSFQGDFQRQSVIFSGGPQLSGQGHVQIFKPEQSAPYSEASGTWRHQPGAEGEPGLNIFECTSITWFHETGEIDRILSIQHNLPKDDKVVDEIKLVVLPETPKHPRQEHTVLFLANSRALVGVSEKYELDSGCWVEKTGTRASFRSNPDEQTNLSRPGGRAFARSRWSLEGLYELRYALKPNQPNSVNWQFNAERHHDGTLRDYGPIKVTWTDEQGRIQGQMEPLNPIEDWSAANLPDRMDYLRTRFVQGMPTETVSLTRHNPNNSFYTHSDREQAKQLSRD